MTAARAGTGASGGAWAAAITVIAISLLSTFTLSSPGSGSGQLAAGPNGSGGGFSGGGSGGMSGGSGAATGNGPGIGAGAQAGGTASYAGGSGANRSSSGPAGYSSAGSSGGAAYAAGGAGGGSGSGAGPGNTVTAPGQVQTSYACSKGQNAGATEVGVSQKEIAFAATVVKTGIAKDFLSDAEYAVESVRQKTNRAGGVCGRQITIRYDDDGWDPTTGQELISKYIGSKAYFGLAVNPSSEGLRGAIDSGLIDQNNFPVVGSDGMLIDQYRDPWVWPVATSTHSVMHIIAKAAYAAGARSFGIVWENTYRFGVEGHQAFVGEAKRLGGNVVVDESIQGGQPSYTNQVNDFISKCSNSNQDLGKCDFIAMLLEPATAEQWVNNGGLGDGTHRPKVGIGAPQPLFLTSFAQDCQRYCANLQVWTSFKPPIPPFDTDPAVAAYKNDLASVSSTADPSNPENEGAYVGMELLVNALQRLGAAPTRTGMRQVLDSTTFDSGLAPPMTFGPGNHFAATSAQAFQAIYNLNSFVGWRYAQTGFVPDPAVSQDMPG